ncbi:MAG: integrase [Ruminococcaceae bacterium]|nr:integrase [Oscillospiraceae bacterium]
MEKMSITLDMVQKFKEQLYYDEKSEVTIGKYMHDILCFVKFTKDKEINKALVLEYKAFLEKEYAISSCNSMIAAINSFFRFIGRFDCIVKQFKVQRKAFCSEDKELSRGEYIRLIETAKRKGNERLSLIIQTICGTGIRVSELEYITVEAVRQGQAVVSCKNKTRTVFIVRDLQKKLLKYIKDNGISSGIVFVTKNGKPVSRCNIWRDMKALCKEAGVSPEKVFPHNLRHLFARTFYGIEKDIAKLADILGHSSINTTRIYIITTGEEHRRKMEGMRLII